VQTKISENEFGKDEISGKDEKKFENAELGGKNMTQIYNIVFFTILSLFKVKRR